MDTPQLKEILARYNSGQSSLEEQAIVESWYLQHNIDGAELSDAQIAEIINLTVPPVSVPRSKKLPRWIAAAAAVLVLSLAGVLYLQKPAEPTPEIIVEKNDINPGSNKAILSLANGEQIVLDDAKIGNVAAQQDVNILKNEDGSLIYSEADGKAQGTETIKNTMSTPRGGQYRLTLSDGTKVWLNASSSITYPVHFPSRSREVQVTGEVYFEVTHNGSPFTVHTTGQSVEVLGTKFNVNAYSDESYLKTTLVEGSVNVKTSGNSKLLRPGQQAITMGEDIKTARVDIDSELAWTDGDFSFNSRPLKELMRDVARWYDIEIDYTEYTDRRDSFTGLISRSRKLSAVLKMIEKTNSIKFRIAGKRLYVIN